MRIVNFTKGLALTLVGALCASAGSVVSAAPQSHAIALTGTDGAYGPGQGAGITFGLLDGIPSINNSGHAVFRGNNNEAGTPQGLWTHNGISNGVSALGGAPMPGGGVFAASSGGSISNGVINTTHINNAGQTAFRIGASYGVFSNVGSGNGRVMLSLDEAPGTGGATYQSVSSGMPLFNAVGQSAYVGSLSVGTGTPPVAFTSGSNNSSGIWIGTPGAGSPNPNVNLALRSTDWHPVLGGTAADTKVGTFNQLSMSMNGNGRFAVYNTLQGSGVSTSNTTGNANSILSNRNGGLEVIARQGMVVPDETGAPSATDVYRSISTSQIGLNDAGHVAFSGTLRTSAGVQTSAGALFTDQGTGTLRRVANAGTPMPAVLSLQGGSAGFSGTNWGSSYSSTVLTSSDKLIFSASGLSGGDVTGIGQNDSGIFSLEPDGSLLSLVRNYDAAPVFTTTLDPGEYARFQGFQSGIAANALGQIAFTSTLGSSLGATLGHVNGLIGNNSGLFASDVDGSIFCIAQKGELFFAEGMTTPLIVQSIGGVQTSGGQDGHTISLNDSGDLVYTLSFADGSSGVFTTRIPEPSTLALLCVSVLAIMRRRR